MVRGVHSAFGLSAASPLGDHRHMARQSNNNRSPRVFGVVLAALAALAIGAAGSAVGCVPEQPDGLLLPSGGSTTGGDPKDAGTSVN